MKRILLSLTTIGLLGASATAVTAAFFTSTQTLANNVVTAGEFAFSAGVTDVNGSNSSLSASGLGPGQKVTRCLYVKNTSTFDARFKFYRTSETGDPGLGDALRISAVINPTSGACSGTPAGDANTFVNGATQYSLSGSRPQWQAVPFRGTTPFSDPTKTPFTILSSDSAVPAGQYLVFAVDLAIDPSAGNSIMGQSYTSTTEVLGMQKEGTEPPGTGWDPQ